MVNTNEVQLLAFWLNYHLDKSKILLETNLQIVGVNAKGSKLGPFCIHHLNKRPPRDYKTFHIFLLYFFFYCIFFSIVFFFFFFLYIFFFLLDLLFFTSHGLRTCVFGIYRQPTSYSPILSLALNKPDTTPICLRLASLSISIISVANARALKRASFWRP